MKGNKKKILKRIVIIVVIAFAISFVLPVAYSPWTPLAFFVMGHQAKRMRVRLLCKTDHQALLEACREVLRRGDLKPGPRHRVRDAQRRPEVSRLPQPILDLGPSYVRIDDIDGYMTLEMHGGMDHFGVYAYPEDYQKPFRNFEYRDRKLIEGLWYYDDGYLHNPEYDKRVEALIQKWK